MQAPFRNAGPIVLEREAGNPAVLVAAYTFSIAILSSMCLYWCFQRCFYGWASFLLKLEADASGYREVEDLFLELTQQSCRSALYSVWDIETHQASTWNHHSTIDLSAKAESRRRDSLISAQDMLGHVGILGRETNTSCMQLSTHKS
jgi:hypothetical protein